MSADVVAKNKVVYMTYTVLGPERQVMGQNDMPIGYVHGAGSGLFEKIEATLEGHAVGEQVEVPLSPEEGFGPADPNLIITEAIDNVPPPYRRVGAEAEFQNAEGEVLTFRVVEVGDDTVTLDGNHPLAGKHATCVVEIVSVREATPEEVLSGFPAEQGAPKII